MARSEHQIGNLSRYCILFLISYGLIVTKGQDFRGSGVNSAVFVNMIVGFPGQKSSREGYSSVDITTCILPHEKQNSCQHHWIVNPSGTHALNDDPSRHDLSCDQQQGRSAEGQCLVEFRKHLIIVESGPLGALNQDGHPTSVYIQAKLNSGLVLVTSANLKGYAAWPAPLNLSSDLSSSESLAASNLGWSLFNPRNQQEVDESLANSPCTPGQDQAPTDTTTMTSGTKESDSGFTSQERREDIATSGASYSRHTSDGATATLNNPSSAVDTENQAGSVPIASMIPDATVSAPNHARRYLIAVAAVAGFLLGAMASAYLFPISESIRACASSNPCTIHDPQMANSSKALPDKSAPKAIRHGVCTIQMARISKDCPVHLDQGATRHDAGSQGRGRSLADSFNSCKLPSLPENMLDGIKSRVQEFRRSGYMEFYPAAPPRLDSKQFRGIDSGRIDELVGQEQHGDHISSEGTPVSFSDASRQQLEHHVDASLDTDSPGGGNWVRDQNGRLLRREDGLEGVGASKFKADAPHVPTTI